MTGSLAEHGADGAATGIGRACARALARGGAHVVVTDPDAAGAAVEAMACDVTDDCDVDALFRHFDGAHGGLHVLVCSAGIFPRRSLADTTVADLDRVMSVNYRGAASCALQAMPRMQRMGGGSIVFMTSGSGLATAVGSQLQVGFGLYGASKAALDRWVLGVAGEAADIGVAMHALCPGAMVMTDGVLALGLPAEQTNTTISADDVATAVVHLAAMRPAQSTGRRLLATEFGHSWGTAHG